MQSLTVPHVHVANCLRVSDAPALGCAILGAVAAGLHPNIVAAVEAMVHVSRVIQPDPKAHEQYQRYYRAYKALVRLWGGGTSALACAGPAGLGMC